VLTDHEQAVLFALETKNDKGLLDEQQKRKLQELRKKKLEDSGSMADRNA
jgi:hypothetical protein